MSTKDQPEKKTEDLKQFKKAFKDIFNKEIEVALVEEVKKGIEDQKLTTVECSKAEIAKSNAISQPDTAPEK
jgi:hypothetical protein